MPTTDRYVSASEPSSISSSPFAADPFRTNGVLVGLQLSIPSIVSMLSTYAPLLLRVILSLNFVMQSPRNNTDLPFSLNSTRLSFNVFSSCTKKLSRCFRFPTLQEIVLMRNRNDRVFVCVDSLLHEATWFGLQAVKTQFQHRCLKMILPLPWRTLVTVQVSLALSHNTWFTVLSWRRDKEMFLQHRMKKNSRNVRHCHFHVLCQSQRERNSCRHDRRCSSEE